MPEQLPKTEIENVDIRSEPVQDILTYVPHWLVHSGTTVVFVVVVFLFIGSYIIKYPDTIHAKLVLTTEAPPLRVFSRASGKIDRLFVGDQQRVEGEAYIAVLENAANLDHVLWLKKKLPMIRAYLSDPQGQTSESPIWKPNVQLGDLQPAYARFLTLCQRFQALEEGNPAVLITEIKSQVTDSEALSQRLFKQRNLYLEELVLAEKKYKRNRQMFQQTLISEADQNEAEIQLLSKQQGLEVVENAVLNNRIKIAEFRKNIITLKQQFRERQSQAFAGLEEGFKQLESEFAGWEHRFVLKAPDKGEVSFFKFWGPNQYVKNGEEVFTIIPEHQALVGQIYLPQRGSGKVLLGQLVNIKFESYPSEQFGMVIGEVEGVSEVTRNGNYLITVNLPSGLASTYGKQLEYRHDMVGTAAIVTEEMRLLHRIFNQFRHLWSSYT